MSKRKATQILMFDERAGRKSRPDGMPPHDWFVELLSDGRWHHGDELNNLGKNGQNTLGVLVREADGEIISGPKGYKLTRLATHQEILESEKRNFDKAKIFYETGRAQRRVRLEMTKDWERESKRRSA